MINLSATKFKEKGFCVYKNLIPKQKCDQLAEAFQKEVKTFDAPLLRQRNVEMGHHRFSRYGQMNNALLDVHLYDQKCFSEFRSTLALVLKTKELKNSVQHLLQKEPILVQTMYFESSKGTPPHYDTFFIQNSGNNTEMVGMWMALENIDQNAGPFYVYPTSHLVKEMEETKSLNSLYQKYKEININMQINNDLTKKQIIKLIIKGNKTIEELIENAGWPKVCPKLKKGDVLFFHGNILHGSNIPTGSRSRNSLTAQFIPFSENYAIRYRGSSSRKENNYTHFGNLKINLTQRILPLKNVTDKT